MNYLVSIANSIMSMTRLMADEVRLDWVDNLVDAINKILPAILIITGAAGTIYAVVIGVNMARADSTEKREEAKKRLINVIVGIAIIIGLILFLQFLTAPDGIFMQMLGYGGRD